MAGGLTDTLEAVHARLVEIFDSPDVAVWAGPPAVEGRLPAVWPETPNGGGPNTRDRFVLVRVVYVPAPRANDQQWPDAWAAIDELDAGFARPLPAGIEIRDRRWTADTVAPGDITRDAVLYDLSVYYPTC